MIMKLSAYYRLERERSDVTETPLCSPKFFQYFLNVVSNLLSFYALTFLSLLQLSLHPLHFTFGVVSLNDEL